MLGIDVSKASLTCTLVDPGTEKTRWSREFPNTPAGLDQLLRRTPADVAWVVEPTGPYSKLVVATGLAAQRRVLLAQTRRAKAFLASETDGLKTDKVDSRGLALYGLARRLPPFPQKSALVDRLDQLQSARKGLSLAISRLQQQAQVLPYAAESLRAAQQDLEARRTALDVEIQAVLVEGELASVVKRLQAVSPGSAR
jgi:transposase